MQVRVLPPQLRAPYRSHRLAVRTPASHVGSGGSSPPGTIPRCGVDTGTDVPGDKNLTARRRVGTLKVLQVFGAPGHPEVSSSRRGGVVRQWGLAIFEHGCCVRPGRGNMTPLITPADAPRLRVHRRYRVCFIGPPSVAAQAVYAAAAGRHPPNAGGAIGRAGP